MRRLMIVAVVLALAACEVEEQPSRWQDHLDPYMAAQGYTMAPDGETILKDGYPVWQDRPCITRSCILTNRPLVPSELVVNVRRDFFAALESAQQAYVDDFSKKIGIEPHTQHTPGEEL